MSMKTPILACLVAVSLTACGSDGLLVPGAELLPTGSISPPTPATNGAPPRPLSCANGCLLPGITVVHRGEMPVVEQSGPFTLIHALLDFQPGTWFPAHAHGGPTLYTLVEGSVTVHEGESETEYGPGESYHHDPGQVLAAGNPGAGRSVMAVAFILPEGEDLVTFHHHDDAGSGLPPPETLHSLAVGPLEKGSPFTVIQLAIELEAGAWTPVHPHPGPSLVTVLEGEVILRVPGKGDESVSSGDGWTLPPDRSIILGNPGTASARLVGTYLVPEGERLTTIPGGPIPQ
jgi:quercetin dioxygenase-like cupin family protein